MQNDHSGAIWVLGILLVIAVSVTSPYWQAVGGAAMTGSVPEVALSKGGGSAGGGNGVWLTLGALLMVLILAGIAQVSEGAGAFALVLLLGLWVLFLLGHTGGVAAFFGRFQ